MEWYIKAVCFGIPIAIVIAAIVFAVATPRNPGRN